MTLIEMQKYFERSVLNDEEADKLEKTRLSRKLSATPSNTDVLPTNRSRFRSNAETISDMNPGNKSGLISTKDFSNIEST